MERYLSIVLSDDCHISKTLIVNNSYELDKYIFEHFDSSEQVRQKFNLEISSFLDENKNLIHSIENKTNKMYRGQIVILQVNEDGALKRVKVIYKSDVKKVKNELLLNQAFMKKFVYYNRRYFSQFIYHKTRYLQLEKFYKSMMKEFYNKIKNDVSFFEFCRTILKYAEKQNIVDNNVLIDNIENAIDLIITDDPDCSYRDSFDPDLEFHPDLDDIAMGKWPQDDELIVSNENEVEEKSKQQKRKSYKIDPNQLSFFD